MGVADALPQFLIFFWWDRKVHRTICDERYNGYSINYFFYNWVFLSVFACDDVKPLANSPNAIATSHSSHPIRWPIRVPLPTPAPALSEEITLRLHLLIHRRRRIIQFLHRFPSCDRAINLDGWLLCLGEGETREGRQYVLTPPSP